ncbi:hypothetical protein [Mycolicibacterium sp. CBMA 234]|uniref:hypothetical protein n=1 Tax=Mycolicibacterium sp. CBMA 234 TaxID=1918495 RepID=UPI0012DDBBA2|nr:hypothetical protein [Mycolicibacterium sp. CBMA 234]
MSSHQQLKATLISTPDTVSEKYCGLTTLTLIQAIARCRPDTTADPWAQSLLTAAKAIGMISPVQFENRINQTAQTD